MVHGWVFQFHKWYFCEDSWVRQHEITQTWQCPCIETPHIKKKWWIFTRASAETLPPVDVKCQEGISIAKDHHSAANQSDNLQQHPKDLAAQLYTILPNTSIIHYTSECSMNSSQQLYLRVHVLTNFGTMYMQATHTHSLIQTQTHTHTHCAHTYIHIHTHTNTHTQQQNTHTHSAHIHTHKCAHTQTHTHTHIICTNIPHTAPPHTCPHTQHTHTCMCTHMHVHTHTHTCMYTHHTQTHTHLHTHTHTPVLVP